MFDLCGFKCFSCSGQGKLIVAIAISSQRYHFEFACFWVLIKPDKRFFAGSSYSNTQTRAGFISDIVAFFLRLKVPDKSIGQTFLEWYNLRCRW